MTLAEEAELYRERRRKSVPGLEDSGAADAVVDPQLDRAVDAITGVLLYADKEKSGDADRG